MSDKLSVRFVKDFEMTDVKLTVTDGPSFSWSMPEFADDESHLYWLSFCDNDKAKGEQFLGVSIVRVTGADVNAIALELMLMFPMHDPEEGPWIAAATRKAHRLGINPGGQVLCQRLTGHNIPDMPTYPEDVMLTPEQVAEFGVKR